MTRPASTAHERGVSPPGMLVDVDGGPMHFIPEGSGQPTVLFESGLGTDALIWRLVQPLVAQFTRTIAYDRAGLGWSDPAFAEPTPANIVHALHAMLTAAGEQGPFVLVGHSIGGIYVRAFAEVYPIQVAGLVLIDSPHEELNLRLPAELLEADRKLTADFVQQLDALIALSHEQIIQSQLAGRPPGHKSPFSLEVEALRLNRARPEVLRSVRRELLASEATVSRQLNRDFSLGAKPVAVLIAGDMQADPSLTWEQNRQADEPARTLQKEMAALSTTAKVETIAGCGHLIHVYRPDAVFEAIRWVLDVGGENERGNSAIV